MQLPPKNYKGIYFMVLAALAFSVMGGFVKELRTSFNTPQLVFYRNLVGAVFLSFSLARYPVTQSGGKFGLLLSRGFMGTIALYTLLYLILHIPLGAAMTYNTMNTFIIALLSWWLYKEKLTPIAWLCIVVGFGGILLIYPPSMDFGWKFHLVGFSHAIVSALSYLLIGTLNKYYDSRIIVLSFLLNGMLLPLLMMTIRWVFNISPDDFFFPLFALPKGSDWLLLAGLGFSALFGQYFVTKAYSNDKAGIVAAIGFSNIVFGMIIGILLGDLFPDSIAIAGAMLVIAAGVTISLSKDRNSN
ncbi:MAG: DMT family transporter [Chitinophagaceae bacterium]|nr:DMT family transporter [Chitinophagaceae bacterium]